MGKALTKLHEVLEQQDINTNEFLSDVTIRRFKFVTEPYWKVLKKCLLYEKIETDTPRDVMAKAYQFGPIDDQKIWIAIEDRNNTSHVYKEDDAKRIFERIKQYEPVMVKTYEALKKRFYQAKE